jgi:hypothetical protein
MTCGKERGQRRNALLRKVPCGAKSICMVKKGSLDEEHSTPRVKRMTFLLLDHESTLLMRDTSSRRHLKHSKGSLWGITHYSRHVVHIFGGATSRRS